MSPSMSPIELYNEVKNTVKPVLYAASGWVSWIIVFGHVFGLYDTEDGAKQTTLKEYTKLSSFYSSWCWSYVYRRCYPI